MSKADDQLIAEFNARRSEEAFAALVRQHVNLVFATALRQVGDAGTAEEIAQNVFMALAQGSGKLGSHPTIAGWLYQTTLNKSREWLRSELRRRRREQTAADLELTRAEGDSVWSSLVPLLDEALLGLREPDRLAVILHFMEGQTFREVGRALGVGEDAARKRVNGCLDQLTDFFRQRGFAVPALAAGAPLFTLSAHVAPAGLASSATTAGLAAAHSAASTSTLTLIKGALKIMAWTKANTTIVAGVCVLLAAGTVTVGIEKMQGSRIHKNENGTYDWQVEALTRDNTTLESMPPLVEIVPTKFPRGGGMRGGRNNKLAGINQSLSDIIRMAYRDAGPAHEAARLIVDTDLPSDKFDFIASLPRGSAQALQQEIKKQFGVMAKTQKQEMDVLLLTVKYPNAPGLKPSGIPLSRGGSSHGGDRGDFVASNMPIGELASLLERVTRIPVIDETGLGQQGFNVQISWRQPDPRVPNVEGLKQAVLDQIGLELVPATRTVEMLVVEKAAN